MVQRPDLRILLMSATLNAELFSQYFNACSIVNIPGEKQSLFIILSFKDCLSFFCWL